MMIFIQFLSFAIGFLAHKTRPLCDAFSGGFGNLLSHTIGIVLYIPLSAASYFVFRKYQNYENIETYLASGFLTALSLGGGVAVGYIVDALRGRK